MRRTVLAVVNSEAEAIEAGAALHDATFARTCLFFMAGTFGFLSIEGGVVAAFAMAFLAGLCGVYFQTVVVPERVRGLAAARRRSGEAVVALMGGSGQTRDTE
jgi:hypothetical protein